MLGKLLQEVYKAGRLQMCLSAAEEKAESRSEEPCLLGTGTWIVSHRQLEPSSRKQQITLPLMKTSVR